MKVKNNLIKYQMKEKGISYSDLANLLDCNEQNLYNMLTKNSVPAFTQRLVLICKTLDLSLYDVFELEGGESGC